MFVNTLLKGDNKDDDAAADDNNTFCRMGTYSLHLEFCSEFRVHIRGKVIIFSLKMSLDRSY